MSCLFSFYGNFSHFSFRLSNCPYLLTFQYCKKFHFGFRNRILFHFVVCCRIQSKLKVQHVAENEKYKPKNDDFGQTVKIFCNSLKNKIRLAKNFNSYFYFFLSFVIEVSAQIMFRIISSKNFIAYEKTIFVFGLTMTHNVRQLCEVS